MAVTVLLDFHVRPDELIAAEGVITRLLPDTRAFDGCIALDVMRDIADPTHFVFAEKWDSVEAYQAYDAWRGSPAGASGLRELFVEPAKVTKLRVDPAL
jgi:heme oxygenase (mycobilin-producing)